MDARTGSPRGRPWISIALLALAAAQELRRLPEEGVAGTPVALVTEPGGEGVVSVVTPAPGQAAVGDTVAVAVETTPDPAAVEGFPATAESVQEEEAAGSDTEAHAEELVEHAEHAEQSEHGEEHGEHGEAEGEHGEHGEEGHGEEEEEEKASNTAVAIGATLLSAIGFQMILFYMTNHGDPDMRKYTYQVISMTISIFCAVLIFFEVSDGLHLLMHNYGWHGERVFLFVNFAHMLCWNVFLQIALAVMSQVVMCSQRKRRPIEKIELDLKCWAVLLAHITGFASIHAWCELQQSEMFRKSWLSALAVVPIAIIGQLLLQGIFKLIRDRVNAADDEVDKYEELWDEATADAEDDVMGLAVSFVFAQALRFWAGGILPNAEGVEGNEHLISHSKWEMLHLLFVSWACIAVVFLLSFCSKAAHGSATLDRFIKVMRGTAGMAFAWCFFFSAKWFLAAQQMLQGDQMLITVVEAMLLTMIVFSSIRVLDKLADADWTGEETDKAIIQVIFANGLLVGFGWEQSFDKAIEAIASVMAPEQQHTAKFILAICCVLLIVPAWRMYLLPMEIHEGWDLGFIIDPKDHRKWDRVLNHEKFKKIKDKLQIKHITPTGLSDNPDGYGTESSSEEESEKDIHDDSDSPYGSVVQSRSSRDVAIA